MTPLRKFLICGSGAIVPLLVNLAAIDLQTLLLQLSAIAIFSYILRQVALFVIGGVAGLLNTETDVAKLFQIGIAAPAVITAMLNANQVRIPMNPARQPGASAVSSNRGIDLIASAYAQEVPSSKFKTFTLPEETVKQQFYRGLIGSIPTNVWCVIAGAFKDPNNAEKRAEEIRQKGFQAEVYNPPSGSSLYRVVIGANLTRAEAQALRAKAIQGGLPEDTDLWTFPTDQ